MKTEIKLAIDAGLAKYIASLPDGKQILELVIEEVKVDLGRLVSEISERRKDESIPMTNSDGGR